MKCKSEVKYEYAKLAFERELSKSSGLDSKSEKYLISMTGYFAVMAFFLNYSVGQWAGFRSDPDFLGLLFLFCLFFAFVFLLISFYKAVSSLSISDYQAYKLDNSVVKYFDYFDLSYILNDIPGVLIDSHKVNLRNNIRKAMLIKCCHGYLYCSLLFFMVSFFSYFLILIYS